MTDVAVVVFEHDGGRVIRFGFLNFVNQGSEKGITLKAAQECALRIDVFRGVTFDDNSATRRVANTYVIQPASVHDSGNDPIRHMLTLPTMLFDTAVW